MAKRQYKEALEDAVEMQIRVPGSYFGYSRAVQIHVIRDRFKAAFQTFKKGFDNLKQQQEIDTLARSIYMLDTAAADLGLLNQLEDAHELADMMVTLIPRSPIGYLRAGTVFLLQGRTDKALDMYNRGIARVQGNQQLIQHKEYVLRRFKSNDQISRAPYDILGWIVQYLDSHDLFTCLNVCYDWRVRFQQYPQPWRTIALCNRTNLDFLEHARAHIRAIYIPITDICMVNSCLKLVSGGAFPNLVHLGK
ncbi:hypothetical protein BJV82DRAFT_300528 [Fennellomyces sp. T-0311]|nr:hypothetical protein BJV82DRAFT_300528 [Fennellomyces sp. T-0311]